MAFQSMVAGLQRMASNHPYPLLYAFMSVLSLACGLDSALHVSSAELNKDN